MAWGSGSEGILSGSLDAVHGFAGVPISGFSQLADAMPCTILRYTDQELDSILSENYFYYRDVIPAKPTRDRTGTWIPSASNACCAWIRIWMRDWFTN